MKKLEQSVSEKSRESSSLSRRAVMFAGLVSMTLSSASHAKRSSEVNDLLGPVGVPNSVRRIHKKDGKFFLGEGVRKEGEEDRSVPIASLTKLLTALIVYELSEEKGIDITKTKISIDEQDKLLTEKGGKLTDNKSVPKTEYTIEQLLDMSLIKSTNEATEALARGIIQRDDFIKRMNKKAQAIGMKHSGFDSPSGLSSGNVSTISDLEKLLLAVLNSPYPIARTTQYHAVEIPQVHGGEMRSANRITLSQLPRGVQVVLTKTGFIKESGRCEITIVKLPDDSIYSIILLGAKEIGLRRKIILDTIKGLLKQRV